ncbi:hypothetical protein B0H66DRAFT_613601 [Apodospora peruviana]|uniref:Uncharacterized protein n=1 Tax=Apodospora peruviana TaxID=516989 RepID=A0AAE0MHL7_9PEZI|nr:hypothetical protein B0H66DRAFT_613601 [Apodospora peruviana]
MPLSLQFFKIQELAGPLPPSHFKSCTPTKVAKPELAKGSYGSGSLRSSSIRKPEVSPIPAVRLSAHTTRNGRERQEKNDKIRVDAIPNHSLQHHGSRSKNRRRSESEIEVTVENRDISSQISHMDVFAPFRSGFELPSFVKSTVVTKLPQLTHLSRFSSDVPHKLAFQSFQSRINTYLSFEYIPNPGHNDADRIPAEEVVPNALASTEPNGDEYAVPLGRNILYDEDEESELMIREMEEEDARREKEQEEIVAKKKASQLGEILNTNDTNGKKAVPPDEDEELEPMICEMEEEMLAVRRNPRHGRRPMGLALLAPSAGQEVGGLQEVVRQGVAVGRLWTGSTNRESERAELLSRSAPSNFPESGTRGPPVARADPKRTAGRCLQAECASPETAGLCSLEESRMTSSDPEWDLSSDLVFVKRPEGQSSGLLPMAGPSGRGSRTAMVTGNANVLPETRTPR